MFEQVCTINIDEINLNQTATTDFRCVTSNDTQNEIDTNLEQQLQQIATSTTEGLNITPGAAIGVNIIDNMPLEKVFIYKI